MAEPILSATAVVGPLRERAQRLLDGLGAQTAADQIEVVLVDLAPGSARALHHPEGVQVRHERLPPDTTLATGRLLGARMARGELVAFLEDHVVPRPQWAAAVIEAHKAGPWAAIGYALVNANPGSWTSRAGFLADYGPWAVPVASGPTTRLPSNNIAYRRELLRDFEPDLGELLATDFNLHERLEASGERLYMAADAVIEHENYEDLGGLLIGNYRHCRLLAHKRARLGSWGRARRAAWAIGVGVAVVPLKLIRLARGLRGRRELWTPHVVAAPIIVLTHVWSAVGEARGYLDPSGRGAAEAFTRTELETPRAST